MEVRKLLIAEGTEEFRLALADALQGAYYIRTCRDGNEALELLRSFGPDIVILDLLLPGMDGISVLEAAAAAGIRPVVLATTRFSSDYVSESLGRLGVGYLMMKPCNVSAAVARLADLNQRIQPQILTRPDPRTHVTNALCSLGMPTKLRGYGYAREAVLLVMQKPSQSVTKELYPAVAAICGCEAIHVERSIRSAIASAWEKRDERIWRQYFTADGDGHLRRPTNAAFITGISESLKLSGVKE